MYHQYVTHVTRGQLLNQLEGPLVERRASAKTQHSALIHSTLIHNHTRNHITIYSRQTLTVT